jgi:hypothetical protein
MARFQHPVDARPADLERLGDLGGAEAMASATRIDRWRTSIMQVHFVMASMRADLIQRTWARFLAIAVKLVTHVSSLRFQLSERAHRAV